MSATLGTLVGNSRSSSLVRCSTALPELQKCTGSADLGVSPRSWRAAATTPLTQSDSSKGRKVRKPSGFKPSSPTGLSARLEANVAATLGLAFSSFLLDAVV